MSTSAGTELLNMMLRDATLHSWLDTRSPTEQQLIDAYSRAPNAR